MADKIYTIEPTKEEKKLKKQQEKQEELEEDIDFLRNGFFYFYYEKLDNRSNPHNFRLELQKIYCYMYYKKRICEIPKITKLKLKFGQEYNMIFENREDYVDTEKFVKEHVKFDDLIFDKSRFKYIKNIEGQEFGIVDN